MKVLTAALWTLSAATALIFLTLMVTPKSSGYASIEYGLLCCLAATIYTVAATRELLEKKNIAMLDARSSNLYGRFIRPEKPVESRNNTSRIAAPGLFPNTTDATSRFRF